MSIIQKKLDLLKNNKVVNWHEHVYFNDSNTGNDLNMTRLESMIYWAKETEMDILVVSRPISYPKKADAEEMRKNNNLVAKAMSLYPEMIEGFAYINPGYVKEALDEIERCINELGMIGIKVYNQYHISDPVFHPVIEKCIQLDIPILMHAGKLNYKSYRQPFISDGTHFRDAARKFPEAVFIEAHIGGGGDWQWSLKAIQDCPNVFIDISGSVFDEGIIEQSVRYLGADRILFGTDGSIDQSIGKLTNARISVEDKIKILNNPAFEKYLERER